MIDMHIIETPGNNKAFLEQVERARHPKVNVWFGKYVHQNTFAARREVYQRGVAEFVTYVDDDDTVLDVSWLDTALQILEDPRVSAVYPTTKITDGWLEYFRTPEAVWSPGLQSKHAYPVVHNFTIMRRKCVQKTLDEISAFTQVMRRSSDMLIRDSLMRYGKFVHVPVLAYEWKLRKNSGRFMVDDEATSNFAVAHRSESLRTAYSTLLQRAG